MGIPRLKNYNWYTKVILTEVRLIPQKTSFDILFFKEKKESLYLLGCWPFALHRPEWMDSCELRFVVSRSVWRWWRIAEERAYGCDQGQAVGKNRWANVKERVPSQLPDVLSVAGCYLTDVFHGACPVISQQQISVYTVGRLLFRPLGNGYKRNREKRLV